MKPGDGVILFCVLVHLVGGQELAGGFGKPDDFASWIGNDKGGLRFPVYNQEIYGIDPDVDLAEVCESTLKDSIDDDYVEPSNSTCQYNNVTDKVICKRTIDFQFLQSFQQAPLRSLVVSDYLRELRIEALQNETIGLDGGWKSTAEISPSNIGIGMRVSADISLNESISAIHIVGDTFSNELLVGWRFTGNVSIDMSQDRKLVAQGRTDGSEGGWRLDATGLRVGMSDSSEQWSILGTIYVDLMHTTLCFTGTANATVGGFAGWTWTILGNVRLKEIPLEWDLHCSIASTKTEEITIPQEAFSGMAIRHVYFQNSVFLGDFDENAFQNLTGLETLTFRSSKLEEVPHLDTLLSPLLQLKAFYMEDCATPNLVIGKTELSSHLELMSFKGSGPLTFDDSTFSALQSSKLKYLNLQDCNIKLSSSAKSVLRPVLDSLKYLDMSYTSLTEESDLMKMLHWTKLTHLSLAGLRYQRIPKEALKMVANTLEYLTLKDNNFRKIPEQNMFYVILDLPAMPNLKELDLRNCEINFIERGVFDNITNLKRLYLSHNNIENLQEGWVDASPLLTYLDLSYNGFSSSVSSLDVLNLKTVLSLSNMQRLRILDLSNGVYSNVEALVSELPNSLIGLSLCNTGLRNFTEDLFTGKTQLIVLDASNNPLMEVTAPITSKLFKNLKSLKYLHLKNDRMTDMFFYYIQAAAKADHGVNGHFLWSLEYLDVSGNNLKKIDADYLRFFPNLKTIDFSSNSITAWQQPILEALPKLEAIFVEDNKIDSLNDVMLSDIYKVKKVRLGKNPFACGCFINKLVADLSDPMEGVICPRNQLYTSRAHTQRLGSRVDIPGFFVQNMDSLSSRPKRSLSDVVEQLIDKEILTRIQERLLSEMRATCISDEQLSRPTMNETLLCVHITDWSEYDQYRCFSEELDRTVPFLELNETYTCGKTALEDVPAESLNWILYVAGTVLFVGVGLGLFYWKWWDIRLVTRAVKEAAVMTFLNRQDYEPVPFHYNVFLSFSDKDRNWVLDDLLPNLESWHDLKVCLHERDFQVGLSILENIISSIDRSQIIVLVLSQSFVKSQWCQFEMHLAQHRLLETRRDQLVLILLERIPRLCRPKTLQYLMMTKTYVTWPGVAASQKDRDEFWSRLHKSLSSTKSALEHV